MYHVYISDGSDDPECTKLVTSHETLADAFAKRDKQNEACRQHTDGEFRAYVLNDSGQEVLTVNDWLSAPADDLPIIGLEFPDENTILAAGHDDW